MSYDLRFAVKAENGMYVDFEYPELEHPTYNVGTIFRKAMDLDFEQGEYYKVSEIKDNLIRGYTEARYNSAAYRQYEPENGWGDASTVANVLESVLDKIEEVERQGVPLDVVYLAW